MLRRVGRQKVTGDMKMKTWQLRDGAEGGGPAGRASGKTVTLNLSTP